MTRRSHFAIMLLAPLFITGVICWLPRGSSNNKAAKSARPALDATTNQGAAATPQKSTFETSLSNSPSFVSNGNTYVVPPPGFVEAIRQRDEERRKEDPGRWWKTPISFYGRAIDQNGDPIAQADVRFEVNDTSARGTTDYYAKSDANGVFSLTGVKGANLPIYITRDGYYQSRVENHNFDYAGVGNLFAPDRNSPIVFCLHKGGEKVPLIKRKLEVWTKWQNRIAINLLKGETNSLAGQLSAELLENESRSRTNKGKWSMRVTMIDGGIQLHTEEFSLTAPESDYQPSVELTMDTKKPPSWGSTIQGGAFFMQTSSGYARAELRMVPGAPYFELIYYLNPSGSRNLEPDPNLLFRDLQSYNDYMATHQQAAK